MLRFSDDAPALIDATTEVVWSHADLRRHVSAAGEQLGDRGLVFLFADTSVSSVVTFLACLESGHPVALVDPTLGREQAVELIERYRPSVLAGAVPDGVTALPDGRSASNLHPDLAVLLSTSGSTGSPKLVRLSRGAIESNADAIIDSLGLTRADVVPTMLPLHYSYGMSLVTSHLLSGGAVVVTDAGVLEPRLWDSCRQYGVTFIAGVPFTYHMLRRTGFDPATVPSLRAMTQAGGNLEVPVRQVFHDAMERVGGRFFVMYGQTEAAPRMACLPHEDFSTHPASAGVVLSGGRFEIEADEVIYYGPNVMMGYALTAADLARGDELGGRLATGDLGRLDDDRFLVITGRLTRIAKVFGLRISLEEVEERLRSHGVTAVVGVPADCLTLVCEWGDASDYAAVTRELARELRLPVSSVRARRVDSLPRLANGKVDYQSVQAVAEGRA